MSWNDSHITPVNRLFSPRSTQPAASCRRSEYRRHAREDGRQIGDHADRSPSISSTRRSVQPPIVFDVGMVVRLAAAHLPVGAQLLEDVVQFEELAVTGGEPGPHIRRTPTRRGSVGVAFLARPGAGRTCREPRDGAPDPRVDERGEDVGRIRPERVGEASRSHPAAHAQRVQHQRLVARRYVDVRERFERRCRAGTLPAASNSNAMSLICTRPQASNAWATPRRAIGTRNGEQLTESTPSWTRNAADGGWPACSPHAPSLIVGLAARASRQAMPDQFADTVLIEHGERVVGQHAERPIRREQRGLDVVTAERVRHLRQVVGAEGEEVGMLGERCRGQRGARRLDHRTDRDHRRPEFGMADLVEHVAHPAPSRTKFLGVDDERDHDLDHRSLSSGEEVRRRGAEGPDLHLVDAAAHEAEPHPSRADHRVRLVEATDRDRSPCDSSSDSSTERLAHRQVDEVREELVQRRIEQPDGDRQTIHGLEHRLEVDDLCRFQLCEGGDLCFVVVAQDEPPHDV